MAVRWVNTDATGGNNDGTSEANGWLTTQLAMDWLAAGNAGTEPHKIWCRGLDTSPVDILAAAARGAPTVFEGYGSSPGDNVQHVIDATGRTNGMTSSAGNVQLQYLFKNMTFQNANNNGVFNSATDDAGFHQCIFRDNGNRGIQWDDYLSMVSCLFTGNPGGGIDSDVLGHIVGCVVDMSASNGSNYAIGINNGDVTNCLVVNLQNGDTGILGIATAGLMAINNTVEADPTSINTTGINMSNASYRAMTCANNVLIDLATGIDSPNSVGAQLMSHNHFDNCTTDYGPGVNDDSIEETTTGDSMLIDRAGNNYEPAPGSPLLQSGLDGSVPSAIPGAGWP